MKKPYLIGLIVVLLVVAALILIAEQGAGVGAKSISASAQSSNPSAVITFRYKNDQSYKPQTVSVEEGKHVVIHVTTDAASEIKLQGYSLLMNTEANKEETLEFNATKTGRFDLTIQGLNQSLGTIEIYPR